MEAVARAAEDRYWARENAEMEREALNEELNFNMEQV
jgi:hypothetical protein